MKLEALQSLSVLVMVVGLFLSALGGMGAYFFRGGSERPAQMQASAKSEMPEPSLPAHDADAKSKLAAMVEPIPEVTAKQLSLNPEPKLPPIAEKLSAPEPVVAVTPIPAQAPETAKAPVEEKPIKSAPIAEKIATPISAPHVSAIQPAKPAAPEPAVVVAKVNPAPTKPIEDAPVARIPEIGLEPWQREKLLQRLRAFQNGTIALEVPAGNDGAMSFAVALKESFLNAGWHVTGPSAVKAETDASGLTLSSGTFPPPSDVTTIFSALVSAGFKLSTALDPALGKKHAVLFIGSRP